MIVVEQMLPPKDEYFRVKLHRQFLQQASWPFVARHDSTSKPCTAVVCET